jgi:nucleoside-diphosphate-sugar epimerase
MAALQTSAIVECHAKADTGVRHEPEPAMDTPTAPSPARRSVLILGANGRFGCAVAQAFDAAGWRVLAQVRREAVAQMPARAALVRHALADTDALVAAAAAAHAVVHAVNPIYTRWEQEAMPALRAGLAVAERLHAHFLLPGNVYNFGAGMPARLAEDTPQRPTTRKGEIRVAMEALIAERSAAAGFAASVVRSGDFFGAGSGGWFDQVIVKSIRTGKLVYPGPLDVPHAWAYLPDLARAMVVVADRSDAQGLRRWHFEGHTLTGHAFLAALEQAAASLGLRPTAGFRHAAVPWALLRLLGLMVPMWRELARMAYLWRVPHGLDGRRLRALAGPAPIDTPIVDALRAALVALGHAPVPSGAVPAV